MSCNSTIRYDTIRYDTIRYDTIYVCTSTSLRPRLDLASTSPRPRLDLASTSPRPRIDFAWPPQHKKTKTTKKTQKTKCVSNDRSGQCDQNAYRIVKIGAIFGYFRALQSLQVFSYPHGPRQHIFQGFLAVRMVLTNTFLKAF